jgi:hypothetical protein
MRYDNDGFDNTFFRRISYNLAKGRYRFIGKGSGRNVYDLGNGEVVKSAKNMKGIAQNIEEYRIALADDSGMFARVYDVSGDYRYLIMDKADGVRDISQIWRYFHVRSNDELYQLRILQEISFRYDLLIRDLGRAANWGLIGGRPVIVDYGFTRDVRRRFYGRRMRLTGFRASSRKRNISAMEI